MDSYHEIIAHLRGPQPLRYVVWTLLLATPALTAHALFDVAATEQPATSIAEGVVSIALSLTHTCAATTSGRAYCWGRNDNGELGNGGHAHAVAPVAVQGIASGATAVAVGTGTYFQAGMASQGHSCAIVSGAVKCWGNNAFGELGNGTNVASPTPVSVTSITSGATGIAAGGSASCAIVSQAVKCWGTMIYDNSTPSVTYGSTPVSISGFTATPMALAAGDHFACALQSDGVVMCWGVAYRNVLGNSAASTGSTPFPVIGLPAPAMEVTASQTAACAVLQDHSVWCWGTVAQLNGGSGGDAYATRVDGLDGLSTVTAAAGLEHACAGSATGMVHCWGNYRFGKFGDGIYRASPPLTSYTATPTLSLAIGIRQLVSGPYTTCGIARSGALYCWGSNTTGQVGDNGGPIIAVPQSVRGLPSVSKVSIGETHGCAIASGRAVCWGSNRNAGALGSGSDTDSLTPVPVFGLGSGVEDVSSGIGHSCAVVNGSAWCWGMNWKGQLGNGTTTDSNIPTPVLGLSSGVRKIVAGGCALTSSGQVWCWGDYGSWISGASPQTTPVLLSAFGIPAVAISGDGGLFEACFILADGGVRCMGTSVLGDGNTGAHPPYPPVTVTGYGSNAAKVTVSDHSCVIGDDHHFKCWGTDFNGELGDGQAGSGNVSGVPIVPTNWPSLLTDVAASKYATCGLTQAGGVECLGNAAYGQLGDGEYTYMQPFSFYSLTPKVPTGLASSVSSLSAEVPGSDIVGGFCAIQSGMPKCWGFNDMGQLGVGSADQQPRPFRVFAGDEIFQNGFE